MRPIILQKSVSIAANDTTENVLTNERIVQSPITGRLSLYMQSNGANPGEIKAAFFVNSDEVLIESDIGVEDRMPEQDKDGYFYGVSVRQGDRLTLRVTNTTAGALEFNYRTVLAR